MRRRVRNGAISALHGGQIREGAVAHHQRRSRRICPPYQRHGIVSSSTTCRERHSEKLALRPERPTFIARQTGCEPAMSTCTANTRCATHRGVQMPYEATARKRIANKRRKYLAITRALTQRGGWHA